MGRFIRSVAAAIALVAGLAVVGVSGQQQPQALVLPGSTLSILENYLESLRQQAGIPGMSGTVLLNHAVVWEKGFGFQDVENHIAATPDTPYLIGDMSQTVAAVLLLECVEQRRFALDDPFSTFGLSAPEPTATARQLLSHASSDPAKNGFFYSPDRFAQLTALMEWCAPQPYRKSVAHRILDRLAMTDSVPGTDLQDPDLQLPDGLFTPDELAGYRAQLAKAAVPYKVDARGRATRGTMPAVPMTAANGLVSTVRDLANFDKALDGESLLQNDTRTQAWTPGLTPTGTLMPTGLGWFVQYYHGEKIVWHFGYVPNGYSALLLKIPDRNLTFILLANSDGLSAPFQLSLGDVTRSLFATLFLKLAT
ncbi:MAG TPA: serine hydrolase domain-containing protein [Vicinamibacterales bacterium]|jgi:CubicO group peptidase (beta-lactamase class C family)